MKTNQCQDLEKETKVLLEPGSLFVMQQDARYLWRHGISGKAKWIRLPGDIVRRRDDDFVRTSLTVRKLLDGRKKVVQDDVGWVSPV